MLCRNASSIVLATILLIGLLPSDPVLAQPTLGATVQENADRQCTNLDGDGSCMASYPSAQGEVKLIKPILEPVEDDPMLEQMPGLDFKAYRRADISSFYREAPGSRVEQEPKFNGQAGKFVNMSPERLDLYWDSGHGSPGNFIAHAGPFESTGTCTFPTHVFYFIRPKTMEVVCSFRMVEGTSVYYCDPFVQNDAKDPSAGVHSGPTLSYVNLKPSQKELYDAAQFNREFAPKYKNFTGGSEWLGNYPTQTPRHHIWRADYFGQQHHIQTLENHFVELPPDDELHRLSQAQMRRNATAGPALQQYRAPGILNITITAVSVAPRIFQIDGFLSDVEVDHLLDLALKKNLVRSTTGSSPEDSSVSDVRTSRTTWLPRQSSPIMDAILRRGADVLQIEEALFRQHTVDEAPDYPDTQHAINEDLQIVHYDQGQQYTAHHDFGYPDTQPNAPSRSINLCMYLNEGMVGGETAFPRWRNAETDDAVKAVPKRGKAMIFYMKNPDGNLDDLSQHAAMPVVDGEKWFANLWTWDPKRN
eukprot:Nitzschia sp. Nitz4//scaffold193_size40683//33718//35395//NITZ4_007505-RA/size40683-augustus-gene-0.58-mRNA-1//-1//CDS//3329540297//4909//frame0